MGYAPYYIAQYEEDSGLNTYFEPFLTPDKAFPVLEDAYCWRGRVKRRKGNLLLGRLRRVLPITALAVTDGTAVYQNADILSSVRATEPSAELEMGYPPAPYVPGTAPFYGVIITIDRGLATETVYVDSSPGVLTMIAGGTYTISSGVVNYITGAITLNFTAAPPAGHTVDNHSAYYPALPVMGLRKRELAAINTEDMIAFDQKYAYTFDIGLAADPARLSASPPIVIPATNFAGRFRELVAGTTWSGDNYKYFWSDNYWFSGTEKIFWVTNFNQALGAVAAQDPIRYYVGGAWTNFNPIIDTAGNTLATCKCILHFKNRLLAFNTIELIGATYTEFPNRVRWSQNGTPLVAGGGSDVTAWRQDIPGKGGYLELPTEERINSVEYIKDVILVKCETSSWKLVYTGNEVLPFVFQKINTDFGSESTFNLIPFDSNVFSIGNYGITTDDSTNVQRIDLQIPDQAFRIVNTGEVITGKVRNQIERVYGIRDFANELVYWSYPDTSLYTPTTNDFCDKLLIYNYRNNSYARFNDSYTCFGEFQYTNNLTPLSIPNFIEIAAGNQQGFVSIMNKQTINGASLAIRGFTAGTPVSLNVPDHNMSSAADYWVKIQNIVGTGVGNANPASLNYSSSGLIYHVKSKAANTITLEYWNTALTPHAFTDVTIAAGGTYVGGGTITIIQNFDIQTKVFAPFYEQGQQVRLGYIDFLLDTTTEGETGCDIFVNEYPTPINDASFTANKGLVGSNVLLTKPENPTLIPMQANQKKIWHRFFVGSNSENFQIQLRMTNEEMASLTINDNDFVLHVITLYLSQNARMTE